MQIRAAILWEQGKPLSVESARARAARAGRSPGRSQSGWRLSQRSACDQRRLADEGPARARSRRRGHRARAGRRRHPRRAPAITSCFCWAPACGKCPPCREGTPLLCDRLEKTTFRNKLPSGGTRLRAQRPGCRAVSRHRLLCDAHRGPRRKALVPVPTRCRSSALARRRLRGRHRRRRGDQRRANSRRGAVVAVIGAGGVGVNVVQGAVLAGAARDHRHRPRSGAAGGRAPSGRDGRGAADRQDVRGRQGADRRPWCRLRVRHGRQPGDADGRDCSRRARAARSCSPACRASTPRAAIRMYPFVMQEKRLIGSVYGSGNPLHDIERLVNLHPGRPAQAGRAGDENLPPRGGQRRAGGARPGDGGRGVL